MTSRDEHITSIVQDILRTNRPIGSNDALIDLGLNSILMIELLLAIEARMKLTFENGDLSPQNFSTVGKIAELVQKARNTSR